MIRDIVLHDLDFDEIEIPCQSTRGSTYFRKVRVGMPRIPQTIIDSVFYLYENKSDAEKGINPGGTGFIVSFRGAFDVDHYANHYYAVTNWHVAVDRGYSVVRLNTIDGGTDILEFGPEEWDFIPSDADVAVLPIDLDPQTHRVNSISEHLFAHKEGHYDIGVGDDVFMLGLFIDHDGVTTNIPKARFGNISMMPSIDAPVLQPTRYNGESYIVDLHSRTGFSGSPVFVYRTPLSGISGDWSSEHFMREARLFGRINVADIDRQFKPANTHERKLQIPKELNIQLSVQGSVFFFLGIHWGQFPEEWEVKNLKTLEESRKSELIIEGAYVKGNSGMTCVIPSWKVYEVLNMPKLKAQRDERNQSLESKGRGQVIAEIVPRTLPKNPDANPNHQEDFNNLLDEAVKGKPKE